MIKDIGDKSFDIWLLGDSNPKNWESVLDSPFDPRHPARHSIWTPVIDVIQDTVFREKHIRVDTRQLYIRNAIENPDYKPKSNINDWSQIVNTEIYLLQDLISEYKPKIVFSFGAFAFEFGRRVLGDDPNRRYGYWGSKKLGSEFRLRIDHFDTTKTNLIPLLHVSIARGKFIQSHNYFCDKEGSNYFDYVGSTIASRFLGNEGNLDIWIT